MDAIEASNKADSHLHSTFSVTLCNTTSQRPNSDYSPFPQTFLKKDSFTRKRNNDPSHNRTKQKIGFSCLWWVHTFVCVFLFGWAFFFFKLDVLFISIVDWMLRSIFLILFYQASEQEALWDPRPPAQANFIFNSCAAVFSFISPHTPLLRDSLNYYLLDILGHTTVL